MSNELKGVLKRRYPDKSNVLLVNITRLGDMLQATPTIAGMKLENPECKVTVLVEKQFEEICQCIPGIDRVMALDLGMTVRSLAREQEGIIDAYEYIEEVVEELRESRFDYCLNMSSSSYTALLLRLVGVERRGGWTSDAEGHRIIESEWARLFATSVYHQNRQFNSLNLVDVFRCSADVEQHPNSLCVKVEEQDRAYCERLLAEAAFTNTGPLIALQAGASQTKRQWAPEKFAELIRILTGEHKARIVMTGSKKELPIIEQIRQAANSDNVLIAAGKTSVPQLSALLEMSSILITGDTGPMHLSVAVGTPVIAMFLASAFGFETGPYSEGNLILQPVIGCCPCNPNKPCARPDCHDAIDPALLARLTAMRLTEDFRCLPDDLARLRNVVVYRSFFDEFGFCNLAALNRGLCDPFVPFRDAYRKLWLDDLGGLPVGGQGPVDAGIVREIEGLQAVTKAAEDGVCLIRELVGLIEDSSSPAKALGRVNNDLGEVDRRIEQLGYHHAPLAPLTRMFVFAKENISGSGALELASQMKQVYEDVIRRGQKFAAYYSQRGQVG